MKCLSVSALRMGLLLALAAIASPVARAQISSSAFDPNCYFPRIGVPGEIDTIYGSYVGQELGGGLINIGPSPQNPGGPGRLMFGGLAGDKAISGRGGAFSAVDCGPNFDPHHMTVSQFKGFWSNSRMILGHYRSKKSLDILMMDSLGNGTRPKFYWADDLGHYDTSRFSIILFQRPSLPWTTSAVVPYHAYLTSDTAEDIVMYYGSHVDIVHDSLYLAHFKGGNQFYKPGQYILPTEELLVDSNHHYDKHYSGAPIICYGADFRGVGRADCLASNASGDLFLYKNDPPFKLSAFAQAMRDTLLSAEGELRIASNSQWGRDGVAMRAMKKPFGDTSFDLILPLNSDQLRIFRGGPDFGSHRLTIDSAYTLRYPSSFDSSGVFSYTVWGGITNCGDMTGTGRPVLGLGGYDNLSDEGYEAFYVLGDAIDEKVDMIYGDWGLGGNIDTCTIDGDGLQDLANGDPGYNMDGKLSGDDVGTIRFIHGSKKIPVHLNRVEVRKTNPALEGAVTVSPNPCSRFTVVTWESSCSGEVHLTLRDLVGKTVYEETRPTTGDLECFRLDLPPLASGEYFLELQQEPCSQIAKIVVKN